MPQKNEQSAFARWAADVARRRAIHIAGFTVTRQVLAGHDPELPRPYPVAVAWFATVEEAEELAEVWRSEHPENLIRVRPAMGWSLVIHDPHAPRYAKPGFLTYLDRTKAEAVRDAMLRTTPRLRIELRPFVKPEPKPPRIRHVVREDAQ